MLFCIEFFLYAILDSFLLVAYETSPPKVSLIMSNSVDRQFLDILQDNLRCIISFVTEIWYYHTISLNDWSVRKQLSFVSQGTCL